MRGDPTAVQKEPDAQEAERVRLWGIAYIIASTAAIAGGLLGLFRMLGWMDIIWYR